MCFKSVSMVLQVCSLGHSMGFLGDFEEVKRVFKGCFKGVLSAFQWSFT